MLPAQSHRDRLILLGVGAGVAAAILLRRRFRRRRRPHLVEIDPEHHGPPPLPLASPEEVGLSSASEPQQQLLMASQFENAQRRHLHGGLMSLPEFLEAFVCTSVLARREEGRNHGHIHVISVRPAVGLRCVGKALQHAEERLARRVEPALAGAGVPDLGLVLDLVEVLLCLLLCLLDSCSGLPERE